MALLLSGVGPYSNITYGWVDQRYLAERVLVDKHPLPDPVYIGTDQWRVTSRTAPGKTYVVTHRTGGWLCNCRGFHFNHWCDHCRRTQIHIEKQAVVDSEQQIQDLDAAAARQIVVEFMI